MNLYDQNGSIKSYKFYCNITKSNYVILGTKLHFNSSYYVIGAEHKVKRLSDDKTKIFQEHELKKRFTNVTI